MRGRKFVTAIVGASPLGREGLARILSGAGFRVVGTGSSVDDLVLESLPQQQSILLIIEASGQPDQVLRQIESFKAENSTARIAVLTDHCDVNAVVSAFRSGANAYFVRVATCDAFIKSLDLVMLGETILPPEVLSFICDREEKPEPNAVGNDNGKHKEPLTAFGNTQAQGLSAREKHVLRCLTEGDSNKVIARKLVIAEATVKVHVKTILRKTRVENRTQAAIWAMKNRAIVGWKEDGPSAPAGAASPPPASALVVKLQSRTQGNNSASLPGPTGLVEGAINGKLHGTEIGARPAAGRRMR